MHTTNFSHHLELMRQHISQAVECARRYEAMTGKPFPDETVGALPRRNAETIADNPQLSTNELLELLQPLFIELENAS